MSDADLGNWSYFYNTSGQLTRQTDARDQTSCLYYDSLGRRRGRVQRSDESCAATVADAALDSSYVYDPQGRVQSVANANVSRSFSYDSYSRLNRETVKPDAQQRLQLRRLPPADRGHLPWRRGGDDEVRQSGHGGGAAQFGAWRHGGQRQL